MTTINLNSETDYFAHASNRGQRKFLARYGQGAHCKIGQLHARRAAVRRIKSTLTPTIRADPDYSDRFWQHTPPNILQPQAKQLGWALRAVWRCCCRYRFLLLVRGSRPRARTVLLAPSAEEKASPSTSR
jgi:hypothetical protein